MPTDEVLDTLQKCAALFDRGRAISHFDWGASALTAEDIAQLNELPGYINRAIYR